MFLHHVNNIEHNTKKYLYWHGSNPSYTSMILYIKTDTLKNDASSEKTNFTSEEFFNKILGKTFLKQQSHISGLDDLTPFIM